MGDNTYTVEGCGEFPLDMLRYADATPATQDDARTIAGDDFRRVTLRFHVNHSLSGVTAFVAERWRTFGWPIVAVAGEELRHEVSGSAYDPDAEMQFEASVS